MRTTLEFQPRLTETLTVQTGEEFIMLGHALKFLDEVVDRPDIKDWRRLESTQLGNHESTVWMRDRINELAADLRTGRSRLHRGYGPMTFQDDDKVFLEFAFEQMMAAPEDMPDTEIAERHAPLLPACRAIMDSMVEISELQDAAQVEARAA